MMVAELTDVMVYVEAIEPARALLEQLGFTPADAGDGWIGLKHAASQQTIVLTTKPFGSPWAIALASDDVSAAVKTLSTGENTAAENIEYATMQVHGIPLLIYKR